MGLLILKSKQRHHTEINRYLLIKMSNDVKLHWAKIIIIIPF